MYTIAVFLLLCANTEGTSYGRPEGLPSVAKELGCYPKGTLRRGAKPRYKNLNSKIKNAINIS